MNPIFQALNSGYPPEKILEYVSKAIPKLGSTIYQAKSAGYTVKQILGFLAKTSSQNDTTGMSNNEIQARNRRTDSELVKNGLTMAAGAVATGALGNFALRSASKLPFLSSTRGVPNAPGTSHTTQSLNQLKTPNMPSSGSPDVTRANTSPISSEPPINSQSPNIITETIKNINPKEILDSSKSTQQVDALLKSGNDSQQVGGYFRKFHDSIVKQVEKESGKPFEEVVEQYSKEIPKENTPELDKPISSQEDPNNLKELGNVGKNDLKDIEQETESIFSTPSGMGKIKEISGDNVLIEENGKLKQHKIDTLIESPLPEKDIADLYEDLIKGIEKNTGKPVSRNVESAGYDPKNNELIYKPHGSDKFYVYDDISPDDVSLLTDFLAQRKSTGRNFIGAWNAGTESPIGAAMYQLIKKLQSERGGKGNEYKNKFETIYDALEPAKEALKKRYEESKKKAKKPRIS